MGKLVKQPPSFLGVFRTDSLNQYNLTQSDALTLYWFFRSVLSGWMKRAPQNNTVLFWVNYTYAADCLYTTPRAVQDSFGRLCGYHRGEIMNPGLQYPLTKIVIPSPNGKRCYFGINRDPFMEIVILDSFSEKEIIAMEHSMNSPKLIEVGIPQTTGKKGIRPEIQAIINDILQIHQRGKETPLVFSNRLPKSGGTYTKTLLQAAQYIQSIYHGQFYRDYRVTPEFITRNNITEDTRTSLSGMKGSWEEVSKGIFNAAKNYRQWFWLENEPETKDWLPRDISQWLYNQYNQTSIFLACLNGKPFPLRETQADRVYNSLPNKIKQLGEDLYQNGWDSVAFWCKIRDVVDWYESHVDLIQKEPNLRYWFENDLNLWFKKYVTWLQQLNGLYLKQIGINNPTWTAWCIYSSKEHNFSSKMILD
jgi:hypothetical protein